MSSGKALGVPFTAPLSPSRACSCRTHANPFRPHVFPCLRRVAALAACVSARCVRSCSRGCNETQVARQQGEYLAQLLSESTVTGSDDKLESTLRPFQYNHKGQLAYVGDDRAVMDIPVIGELAGGVRAVMDMIVGGDRVGMVALWLLRLGHGVSKPLPGRGDR